MKSNSDSISYLVWFVFPVLAFFVVAVPLSIFLGPISGDLTRIGHWPERDFNWRNSQSPVFARANGAATSSPQVLVLGDSFSRQNIWQSYLAKSNHLEILSFQYQDVGCLDNWLQWVAERPYPGADIVVIQIVERGFVQLFRNMNACPRRIPKSFEVTKENEIARQSQGRLMLDVGYLFPTVVNMLRMTWFETRTTSGGVVNAPLTTGRLFSNRKSDRLLYYAEDEAKLNWSKNDLNASVAALKKIQEDLALRGVRMVLVVVPDKSSVYRRYVADKTGGNEYPNVFEQLKEAGVNNVNLLDSFQQAVEGIVDLYLPNDTHLSPQGYQLMAEKIADDAF